MLFLASIRDALLALEEGQGETFKQLQAVLFHQDQEVGYGAVRVEGHNVLISNMGDKAVSLGHFAFQRWNFSLTQTESCGEVAEGEDVSSCKLLPSFQDRRLWWLYWQDDPDILKIISSRWQSRFVEPELAFFRSFFQLMLGHNCSEPESFQVRLAFQARRCGWWCLWCW